MTIELSAESNKFRLFWTLTQRKYENNLKYYKIQVFLVILALLFGPPKISEAIE